MGLTPRLQITPYNWIVCITSYVHYQCEPFTPSDRLVSSVSGTEMGKGGRRVYVPGCLGSVDLFTRIGGGDIAVAVLDLSHLGTQVDAAIGRDDCEVEVNTCDFCGGSNDFVPRLESVKMPS